MKANLRDQYSALDEALVSIAQNGPELRNGNSNHAPMAIEAMCAMGRGADATPWLDRYRRQLTPRPPHVEKIKDDNWQTALGDPRHTGDWFEFFRNELEERPWRDVLDSWTPRLAPGIVAAAMHGVIRTGHAVRAIALAETPERKRELADGLAYWAAEYTKLPGARRAALKLLPSDAIARVPMLPVERRGKFGSLTGALGQLDSFDEFQGVLSAVDAAAFGAEAFTSDLTGTFTRIYLSNAKDFLTTIAFIHTVTGPAALRPMLPYLNKDAAAISLSHVWQAAAALFATFGTAEATRLREPIRIDTNELIERAIATGDEHAIKFTEVCLSENELSPRAEYAAAARHAIEVLGGET